MDLLLKLPDGSSYHVATAGGLVQPSHSEITLTAGNVFGADNLAVTGHLSEALRIRLDELGDARFDVCLKAHPCLVGAGLKGLF